MIKVDLPPHGEVGIDILGPGELAKDDVVVAFYDLLLVYIVLTKQTQRIGHLVTVVLSAFVAFLTFIK